MDIQEHLEQVKGFIHTECDNSKLMSEARFNLLERVLGVKLTGEPVFYSPTSLILTSQEDVMILMQTHKERFESSMWVEIPEFNISLNVMKCHKFKEVLNLLAE